MKIKKEKQTLAIDEREGARGKGEWGKAGVSQEGGVYSPLSSPPLRKEQGRGTPRGGGTREDAWEDFPSKG